MMRGFALLVTFLAAGAVAGAAHAAPKESDARTLVNQLLHSSRPMGGLADVADNQRFFDYKVTAANLEAVRKVGGQKLVKELGLEDQAGKAMRDFVQDNREALAKHPWLMTALARDVIVNANVPVVLDDQGRTATIADPARTIAAKDLWEHAQGPDASPRALRKYLEDNFGLENKSEKEQPDQIYAFSVFQNFLSGRATGDLKDGRDAGQDGMNDANRQADRIDYLEDNFVRDAGANATNAGSPPAANTMGLFLPSAAALDTMKSLLKLYKELGAAKEAGRDPSTVTDAEGKDLASWLQKLGVGQAPYDVRSMSAAELKRNVMAMMDKLVKKEIEQDNDYVYEESSSATASTDRASTTGVTGGPAAGTTLRPTFVVGNRKAQASMDAAYKRLLEPLSESERTKLELEQDGAFQFRVPLADLGDAPPAGLTKKTYDILTPELTEGGLTLSPQQPGDK